MKTLVAALVFAVIWIALWYEPSTDPYPFNGMLAAPEQSAVSVAPWTLQGAVVTPLANYRVHARVVRTENYRIGHEADFSPYDFVLGWQELTDFSFADKLNIDQGGRWYTYRFDRRTPPIDPARITLTSSNHHIIPADLIVRKDLDRIRAGDIVRLEGKLVSVREANGWQWESSLSRTDRGNHSCELLWVERVERWSTRP